MASATEGVPADTEERYAEEASWRVWRVQVAVAGVGNAPRSTMQIVRMNASILRIVEKGIL